MLVMSIQTIFYIRQNVQCLEYWIPQCIVLDPPFPVWRKTGSDINCELFLDSFDWMAKRQTFTYKLKKCEKWRSLFMRLQAKYVFVQECFLSKSIYQTKLQAVYRTSTQYSVKLVFHSEQSQCFRKRRRAPWQVCFILILRKHSNESRECRWLVGL